MKIKMIVGATLIAAGSVGAAQAATATFDLSKSRLAGVNSAFASDAGSETLAITGTRYRGSRVSSRQNSTVLQGDTGLGLKNSRRRDSWKIDGRRGNDLAVLNFGKNVTLNSITFGSISKRGNAKFDLFMFDGTSWTKVAGNLNKNGSGRVQSFTFAQPVQGAVFGIGARNKRAAFNILSVTTSFEDIAPVPLPAGGLLLLTGLAGIGAARRKKRS